jgi:dienelactone hydrolase
VGAVGDAVAVLGFCLGGTLAFRVAAEADPDAAVAYYGSGIAGSPELADRIECPTMPRSNPGVARRQNDGRECKII